MPDYQNNNGLVWKIMAAGAATATIIGLLINILVNFSDLRSAVRDNMTETKVLNAKVDGLEDREREINRTLEQKILSLDRDGSRNLIGTEAKVGELQKEIDTLRATISRLTDQLISHNDEMINLYTSKKPIAEEPYTGHRHFPVDKPPKTK